MMGGVSVRTRAPISTNGFPYLDPANARPLMKKTKLSMIPNMRVMYAVVFSFILPP